MVDNDEVWDEWSKNFNNAKAFFESKGSIKQKERLKKRWLDGFYESLNRAKD